MESAATGGHAPRWAYAGVLMRPGTVKRAVSKELVLARQTALESSKPALLASFLSDGSMGTILSNTTVTSSHDAHAPLFELPEEPASAVVGYDWSKATRARKVDAEALTKMGRTAKKRVETLAQRDALVGPWRKRKLKSKLVNHNECQVMDLYAPHRNEYKIIARMNISSSLREIMNVLATDKASDFHRAMTALFGSSYITGQNVHLVETAGSQPRSSSRITNILLKARRSSRHTSSSARLSTAYCNTKMGLNSVTLQLRHRFRRRLHDWRFLDYLVERVDAMAVTRVLQTVAAPKQTRGRRASVGNLLVGYVIREDPEAQFTRVFFYAEASRSSSKRSVRPYSTRLLRSMVETLYKHVATVERQRLSALCRLHRESEGVPVAASRCFSCDYSFGISSRRHTCACCRQSVCRKCLEHRDIEGASVAAPAIGPPPTQRVRVCRACVERVSLPALAAAGEQGDADDDDDDEAVIIS